MHMTKTYERNGLTPTIDLPQTAEARPLGLLDVLPFVDR